MALDYKNFAIVYEPEIDDMAARLDKSGVFDGEKLRLQADCHVGKGCAVGTCLTYTDKIVPALVGCDIACRVSAIPVGELDLAKLDGAIHQRVPSGFAVRQEEHQLSASFPYEELSCWGAIQEKEDRFRKSMGTLGSGNHFIAVERGQGSNQNYLMIHCGTRNLGKVVFDYYEDKAFLTRERRFRTLRYIRDTSIKAAAQEERYLLIPSIKDDYTRKVDRLPKELAYLEGEAMGSYLHDMNLLRKWSYLNHMVIATEITNALGIEMDVENTISSIHNYVDVENGIIRKGAVSAREGERGIIPMNMRDGSLLVVGKGNEDYLWSAPHGAGRIMSRAQAKRELDLRRYQDEMSGIYTTSVCSSTLDEAPDAYKKMEDILPAIEPTVDIIERTIPVYNFKAR